MSTTETFPGDRYEIVAWARDQRTLYYRMFGSYQGEWLLLARDAAQYFLYKGSYGSCSGCDAFESEDLGDETTKEQALKFAEDYPSFAEVPVSTMRNLASARSIAQILPANMRGDFTDVGWEQVAADWCGIVRLEESLPVEVVDVLSQTNQEIKRRLLEVFGIERFRAESGATILDKVGEDELLSCDADHRFLYLKDSSTARRYLLRIDPGVMTVVQAKAWTFDVPTFAPAIET